jgi:formyl-CoA transferase
MAALRHREHTGLGQHVDISMFDSMLAMADMVPHLWSMDAPPHWARGGSLGIVAGFRARDGYFVLAVLRPHQFERLARIVGRPEWIDDPRFDGLEAWARQIEPTVRPAVEAWARDLTKGEASRILCEEGVAAGPSNLAADIAADPHVAKRDMLLEVPRPDGERPMCVVGNPVKLSRVGEGPVTRFPRLGQHVGEVLSEILDLDEEEISGLRSRGVI